MTISDEILKLVSEMEQARKMGEPHLDSESIDAQVDAAKVFGHLVLDECLRLSQTNTLSDMQILKTLVGIIGCTVKNSSDNPLQRLMLAAELSRLLLETSIGE